VCRSRYLGLIGCNKSVVIPRSEDCINGRSRCGMEGSLSPKHLNRLTNVHDLTLRATLQYGVHPPLISSVQKQHPLKTSRIDRILMHLIRERIF
jgi:hypothetical protein